MRSVVFGVDGLTFRVLHPMMERGELPNFRRLRQEGCEGILESKYPPLTPPAWTSLSTGLKPARHGVYDFWTYDERQERASPRAAHVQTKRKGGKAIWNILSEYGRQVLVINVPMTYPPEAVNGLMISGYMTPSSETDFTYPSTFKEELYREVPDYQIDLDFNEIFRGKLDERASRRLIDATMRMTEQRIKLITYLTTHKPWDFCYIGFVGPDRLQHPLWDDIISLDPHATEYFRLLDSALGVVLGQLGPDDNLFVVSDHGFQGSTCVFDINEYLYGKGLLAVNAGFQQRQQRANRRADLRTALARAGLLQGARRVKRALAEAGMVQRTRPAKDKPALDDNDLDWERTLAYVPSYSGFGGGYADIFLSDQLGDELLAELSEDLKRQVHPKSGKPLVDALYTTEVLGSGPYAPRERHLLALANDGITFRMGLGSKQLWHDLRRTRGTHHKEGVLYAYGGGIKRGFKAPNAEIYDLVPTVLRSMGLPFPTTFDGRALDELYVDGQQVSQAAESVAGGGLARRKLGKLLED
jgi:predicted AlkP superfamily phosphohydrolase/phosphomutase